VQRHQTIRALSRRKLGRRVLAVEVMPAYAGCQLPADEICSLDVADGSMAVSEFHCLTVTLCLGPHHGAASSPAAL
jgi:hypothetical protein